MPTFPASNPVPVVIDVPFGNLHVVAGDRDDIAVTVLPADPTKSGSVRAAEETRVRRDGDTVTIDYPGSWKMYVLPFSAGGAIVTIELPTGSSLSGKAGSLYAEGRLGAVDLTLNGGDARLDEADRPTLKVSAGSVTLGRATGPTSVKAGSGSVRITELVGDGTVHASNGVTTVGSVAGSLHVAGAHGDIVIGTVRGTLTAKTASGDIRVDSIESGSATLTTSYGAVDVGVPEGTTAWIDVSSQHGTVRNQLRPAEDPTNDDVATEIHATTGYGDIIVRRPTESR